jgi:hypothetical protein
MTKTRSVLKSAVGTQLNETQRREEKEGLKTGQLEIDSVRLPLHG